MPREIIDTQSSRPRYVRRIVMTVLVVVLVAAVLAFLAFERWGPVPGK